MSTFCPKIRQSKFQMMSLTTKNSLFILEISYGIGQNKKTFPDPTQLFMMT